MITAEEARALGPQTAEQVATKLLQKLAGDVALAASRGETMLWWLGPNGEMTSPLLRGTEETYPAFAQIMLAELREAGYTAYIHVNDSAGYDIFLVVNWEATEAPGEEIPEEIPEETPPEETPPEETPPEETPPE